MLFVNSSDLSKTVDWSSFLGYEIETGFLYMRGTFSNHKLKDKS